MTLLPQLICVGDSLTLGAGGTGGSATYPNQTQLLLGGATAWAVSNFGVSSQTIATLAALAPTQIDVLWSPLRSKNVLPFWAGTNDIFNDPAVSGAVAYDRLVAYCAARQAAGWQVPVLSCIARVNVDAARQAERLIFNALLDADHSFCDIYVPLHTEAVLSDPTNLTFFATGGIHLKNQGYSVVASYVAAAIRALQELSMIGNTRVVTSHVLNLHGAARAGDNVTFRLVGNTYSATEHVPEDIRTTLIDSNGNISTTLYCPATYDCDIAGVMQFTFSLPNNPNPTTLESLHASSEAALTPTNLLQTLIDAHVATANPHPQYALIGAGLTSTDLLTDLTIPVGSTYTHPNLIVSGTIIVNGTLYVP